MHFRTVALAMLLAVGGLSTAQAQGLPTEPISLGNGRVVIGAEITATLASADPGYFNFTDYEYDTESAYDYTSPRNFRVGVSAEVRASERLQVLGELRFDQRDQLQPFALYARIRPWPERRFDIQVGRIPPTFGALGRDSYGASNLLIGTPLAYHYLTSLRPDALPDTADDLIRMRGRGWLSTFPRGNRSGHRGVPLINSVRWDTGLQVHGVNGVVEWTGAVTTGSLSNPRVDDDNNGRQVAGRAVVRPVVGLAIGVSAARGAFLSRTLSTVLPPGRATEDGTQNAIAADVEYSAGRFLTRGEVMRSTWCVPMTMDAGDDFDLTATSMLGEARYRIFPGVHVAARLERLGFSRIASTNGLLEWDAPVRRFEVGGGWSVTRNVMVKASWQRNVRDGGRVRSDSLGAAQIVYWF